MKQSKLIMGLFLLLLSGSVFAGPTIIRDSRITDTSITPVLGRGYSIGTNTFQSTCLESVVVTEPSYDLTYSFDSVEESTETTTGKTRKWVFNANTSSEYKNVLKRVYKNAGSSRDTAKGATYSHVIVVNLSLRTYYASVNESQSKLGSSATTLLKNRDIPGFFSSCGPYYVRSIGREAILLSTFKYETTTSERDEEFENMIEFQLKRFRSSTRSSKNSAAQSGSETSLTFNATSEFNKKAESRSLTITTYAFGLGKRQDAEIISYDIDSFKNSIKEAFVSMQNASTGKVINMEVVPWVENTEFQALLELDKMEDTFEPVLDQNGKQVMDDAGNPQVKQIPGLPIYEKKLLLNENAEFIIEIDRVDRNIMNMYYKARLCRRNIDMNWKIGEDLKTGENEEPLIVQNKRFLDQTIPLADLDRVVSKERVADIYKMHKRFMYGEGSKDKGAAACMKAIMQEGIYQKSYREIADCQPSIRNMGEIQNDIIENYCLPDVVQE